ncbi:IS21 family transposase [Daejeonella sp. H1SJ63]|uniref:IS21 family transposase n=1 Tax=Daejeonella sp. H1SJ63 TaxID=3034145 RepID=UPI0023ED8801|nr:IS21 family transposase [Daejeonella sp. H1SJ63]
MSNKLVTMQQVRLIIHYLQRGVSGRKIAQELGLSRNTVKLYVDRILNSSLSLDAVHQMNDSALSDLVYPSLKTFSSDERRSDFAERTVYFLSELKRTGVTRRLLWEEYKREFPLGYEYPQFCELLSRQKKLSNASMHFEYQPADMMLVDFAGDTVSYVDKSSGELIQCPVLVCVLPFSGYSYAVALPNATQPQLLKALNACLLFFGGVPANFKSDNMKQIVQRSCRYEPVFTQMIQQWALHNGLTLLASRVRKPKDKAPVESEVKLIYQRVYAPLRDQLFFSLSELNQAMAQQLLFHHQRAFQKKEANRSSRFMELEKPYLQTLPEQEYIMRHGAECKVQKNYHIILGEDWHQYSVPFSYIGKKVQAVYDTDIVEVFYQHQRIALHQRSYKKHGYTTIAEHMPQGHQRYLEQKGWDADYFLLQAEKMGIASKAYMQAMLDSKRFTEQTYHACLGILRLARSYGTERIEAACTRALKGRTYNYRTIHNILSANLDKLEDPASPDLFTLPSHENLRGSRAFE